MPAAVMTFSQFSISHSYNLGESMGSIINKRPIMMPKGYYHAAFIKFFKKMSGMDGQLRKVKEGDYEIKMIFLKRKNFSDSRVKQVVASSYGSEEDLSLTIGGNQKSIKFSGYQ